jgi:hypothetical protein
MGPGWQNPKVRARERKVKVKGLRILASKKQWSVVVFSKTAYQTSLGKVNSKKIPFIKRIN